MFRLFAFEGHKAVRNLAFWIIFGVMLIVGFWFSGMMFEKLPDVLSSAYGMQYALKQPISRGEYVFLRTISDVSFTAWLSVIAGAMLIGLEFSNRTINHLIYAGNSRLSIIIVKLFYFYISTLILSLVYPIANCLKYSTDWISNLTADDLHYVLRCVVTRCVIDMAMMSFSLISVFVFRDVIRSLGCSLIVIVVLSQLMGLANNIDSNTLLGRLIQYFPAYAVKKIMFRDVARSDLYYSLIYSFIMVFGTSLTCYLLFRRADIK